ncbi:hypothetical protein PR048_002314 [Dryococelus australis]|uniref:Uncharacterized protein n=1 Tax=Dryococelus australis TaxID=614101 RepID=A0ABQ9IJU7_9NEOP|nr:hypothetical protein PR048_002314 [Dryococelus australis]
MSQTRRRKVAAAVINGSRDAAQFRNFIKMTAEDIEYLIQKLGATSTKQDTTMRNAIIVKGRIVGYTTASGISALVTLGRLSHIRRNLWLNSIEDWGRVTSGSSL